jgi:alanine racemase
MPRPLVATLDPAAVAANLRRAREHAGEAKVFAVIKADAYGHGIERILPGLHDADGIALLEIDAAVRLRESCYGGPILLLEGCFDPGDVAEAAARRFSMVVHDESQIEWIARSESAEASPIDVFLKVNTGMNRLGFTPRDAAGAITRIEAAGKARVSTLMTHFARADEPGGIAPQRDAFDRLCEALASRRLRRSLSNSAALLGAGALGGDIVRPGIMLYGGSPFADRNGLALGLEPAMRLESALIGVQDLAIGDRVGYGGVFAAAERMRIGVVACGYADGYPRHAPMGTPVVVCGRRTRTVGRVSMDMLTVDLGPVPEAAVGSPVELWGRTVSVDEVAASAGTIGYELLCALAPRVRKQTADTRQDGAGFPSGDATCL